MKFFTKREMVWIVILLVLMVGLISFVLVSREQQDPRSKAAGSVTLSLTPATTASNPAQKTVGQNVVFDVMVDPGQSLVSLVKLEIMYDPAIFQTPTAASFVTNTIAFPQILDGPVISSGKLAVTLSIGSDSSKAIQVPTKVGTLTLTPKAITPAQQPTTVSFGGNTQVFSVSGADQNINVLGITNPGYVAVVNQPTPTPTNTPTPTPTNTPTPTATPTPSVTKVGITLLLHGIGRGGDNANPTSGGNANPLHPQRNVIVEVLNQQNQIVLTKSGLITFNSNQGNFQGTVDLGTTIPTGFYTVKLKTDQYLRGLVPGIQTLTKGQTIPLPSTTLITGDINNDNALNIVDYNILIGCYSDLAPAVNCTPVNKLLSDLTDDGSVNQFDYNLFLRELTNIPGDPGGASPIPTQSVPTSTPTSTPTPTPVAGGNCPTGQIGTSPNCFPAPPANAASGKQWKVNFNEEFNGTSLDTTKLTPCFDWNFGACTASFNQGKERYLPEQVRISNGTAKLVAEPLSPAYANSACYQGQCTYKAGLVSTARPRANNGSNYLFPFTYGYIESRMKFPATSGFFTAFWMLPTNPNFDYDTEIDIVEILGGHPDTIFMTYHYNGRGSSHNVNNGLHNNGACSVKNYSQDFVRFGLDWQPTHIAWYIDGVKCGQFNGNTTTIESGPMQLILHMMVDNNWERSWGSVLTDQTLIRQLEVDYIRIYQQS